MPTEVDLVREAWVKGNLKRQLGLKDKEGATLTDVETGTDTYSLEETSRDQLQPQSQRSSAVPQQARGVSGLQSPDRTSGSGTSTPRNGDGSRDSALWNGGRGTQMSYYDPDMLPSPGARTPEALGEEAFGSSQSFQKQQQQQQGGFTHSSVPQINIQRASGTSSNFYPYRASSEEDEEEHPATSRVALVDDVGSAMGPAARPRPSAEAANAEATEDSEQSIVPVGSASMGSRWHDRFRQEGADDSVDSAQRSDDHLYDDEYAGTRDFTYQADQQRTPTQHYDPAAWSGEPIGMYHEHENSGISDGTWHTADDSRDYQRS